jgi:hypothetical protein
MLFLQLLPVVELLLRMVEKNLYQPVQLVVLVFVKDLFLQSVVRALLNFVVLL